MRLIFVFFIDRMAKLNLLS